MVAQPAPCRCAVVTGANRGLGLAIARGLAESGAHVVVTAREGGRASSAVAAALRADGLSAEAYVPPLDVGDWRSVCAFGEFCAVASVAPDALVNNAGGQFPSPAAKISHKGWQAVIDTNLTGTFLCCREAYEAHFSDRGGSIVNIIADMFTGFPLMAHTGAARSAVRIARFQLNEAAAGGAAGGAAAGGAAAGGAAAAASLSVLPSVPPLTNME